MRKIVWLSAIGIVASACSGAGDTSGGSRNKQGQSSSGVMQVAGGAAGASGEQSGGLDFGNATERAQSTPVPVQDEMNQGQGSGSSEECEVGVFCAPDVLDGENCGSLRLEADVEVTVQPGNVLVIFDQSVSMRDQWPGSGTDKMNAAQNALVGAVEPLQDLLSLGAIFFPNFACVPFFPPPPGGAVTPFGSPEHINIMPAPQFLTEWNQKFSAFSASLGIGTPLNEAFDRAAVAIENMTLEGNLAVVAFTDGEPNCLTDPELSGVPTALETQHAQTWLGNGIKTYVVGLPGAGGVQVLDDIAQAGGTMNYILPDDPATLEAELRTIVEETVSRGFDSCSINLTPAADIPDELLMIVEEDGVGTQRVPRERGWTLSPDGAHVEITGALCDQATGGRFASITFEYACPDVEPPPPIPPLT